MYKQKKVKAVKDIFECFTPAPEKKDEILNRILTKCTDEETEETGGFTSVRRLSPAFILSLLLVCLTTVTALAVGLGWNEKLIEYLKPSEKQMQELDGAVSTPLAAASQNGVTIEIKQTIADRQGVYILYDVTVPDWIELNDDTVFDCRLLGLNGGCSEKIIEQNKNNRTAIIYCSVNGGQLPQSVKAEFSDLGYYDDTYQFNLLIEGRWTLEFELNHLDLTKTIEVNKKVCMNKEGTNNNTITNIYISPISILINIEGDDLWTAFQPIIRFKNGEEIQIEAATDFNTSYSFRNFSEKETFNDDGSVRRYGVYSISHRFDRITDMSEIDSIIVGNVTIPVN